MSADGTASSPADSSIDSWLRPLAVAPPEPPPVALASGQRLGRYVLGRRIGRGATSTVFVANDSLLGREVALKVLLRPAAGARDDFLREARSAARVKHPGIATVLDAGVEENVRFIAFELVEGQSLRVLVDRIRRGRAIEYDRVLSLSEQIARAADAAHAAAIVHRDLKPENVVVAANGRIKVLDFGLAAAIDSASGWAGTPGYVAPELGHSNADARSDQFAIGVMMVELFTGSQPSAGRPLERLPAGVREIARRATASDPCDRFPSCALLADAIAGERRRERGRSRMRRAIPALCSLLASFSEPRDQQSAIASEAVVAIEPPAGVPVVACPPLATPPGEEWLGAAAASAICRRARAWLGGADGVALPPAALLGLPAGPIGDSGNDPFAERGVRERALSEAEARADIVVSGSLSRDGRSLSLSLVARSAHGVATAEARAPLPVAVAAATDTLFSRAMPGSWPVTSAITRFTDITDQAELLALSDSVSVALSGAGLAWGLERAATLDGSPAATLARSRMLDGLGLGRDGLMLPPIDGGHASYVGLGPATIALGGPPSARTIADAIASHQLPADDEGRPTALAAEAAAWLAAGDNDRARAMATAAIASSPWDGPWDTLAVTSYAQPGFISVGRAYAAWQPDAADAWNIVAQDPASTDAQRLEMFRRAHVLSDGYPLYAGNYGGWLVLLGQREEARQLAADLALGSTAQSLAAARITTDIDIAEGAVEAAYQRAKRALADSPTVGSAERGDAVLFATFVDLGWLLDRQEETGAFVYQTFVAPDPPRLDSGPFAAPRVAHACAHASTTVARACFARLDHLLASGFFFTGTTPDVAPFVEGAAQLARGERRAAARSMRRIREIGFGEAALMAEAFHGAGDVEAADRVDPPRRGLFNGVSLAHVRAAQRAADNGDCDRARSLADEVRRAWSRSDVELAVVARLFARVRRCLPSRR